MQAELRWQQRFQNYESSLVELKIALEQSQYTTLERAGLIQLFEISFELAWKTLKDLLAYENYNVNSPRETLRQAFASGMIIEGELWLKGLDSRNLFTHTYNKQLAKEAVALIKDTFSPLLFELEKELTRRLK
jgi:nucleotidyltransferase substrate binding protein (TIGR01987 family)